MSGSVNVAEGSPKVKTNSKKPSHSPKSTKSSSPTTPKNKSNLISYRIRLLDGDQPPLEISILKNDTGQVLFNKVCEELGGIIERDYFGLRYMDKENQRQWLDLSRSVKKQLMGAHSTALSFRVKHYPGNPIEDFHQEISQYLLYLQVRRDLVQGRLLCPLDELYEMGALILQSEYNDAPVDDLNDLNESLSAEDEYKTYFKNFKIVFNQTKKMESEIINQHRAYRGLTARDAEVEVIKRASKLPTYGVDPFPVKIITKEKSTKKVDDSVSAKTATADNSNGCPVTAGPHEDGQSNKTAPATPTDPVYLGLRHTGLSIYVGLQLNENFEWASIDRLACNGKDFIVCLKPTPESVPNVQEKSAVELEQSSSMKKKKPNRNNKKKKNKPAQTKENNNKPVKARVVTFRCVTKAAALALWKWTVDRQSFFTLKQASEAKVTKTTHSFFRRSHSYRFIGKSQMELKSIADSAESLPQPSFVRVSSLRRPRGQEKLDGLAARATLPARIRPAEPGSLPEGGAAKRPSYSQTSEENLWDSNNYEPTAISTTTETTAASSATDHECGVMNIANDLRAAPGSEANTPIKGGESPESRILPSATGVVANAPCSTDANETGAKLRHRPNHTKPTARDSECLRAINEIDDAIDSIQSVDSFQKPTLPNGEVAPHESDPTTTTASSHSCPSRTIIYAMEAAAFLGIVCFGVIIAALETRPATPGPGRQTDLWTDLVIQLQSQPLVISFNEYVYGPLRGFFVGGGR